MKQDRKDRLENFILERREEFDHLEPNPAVLERIQKEIGQQDQSGGGFNFNFIWRAAALVLLAVSVFLLVERQSLKQDNMVATVEDINPEFYEAEGYFTQMIEEKQAVLVAYRNEYPDLITDFETDIDKLDQMYSQLKKELKSENTEQVVDALIQNLQLRIDILNQQLVILENIRNAQNNEDVNI